jgi:hypothetical protein
MESQLRLYQQVINGGELDQVESLMANIVISQQESNLWASQLEAVYNRYGAGIYSLCLRLLTNKDAAESATIDVFVRFSKELANQPDESRMRLRLRELAVEAALARLRRQGMTAVFHWFSDVYLRLRRLPRTQARRDGDAQKG